MTTKKPSAHRRNARTREKNVDDTLSNREEENIGCAKKKFQKKKGRLVRAVEV
jgi:hypothetical protein